MSPHRQEACASLSPMGQKLFPYIEYDDNEQLVTEVRKHPVGVIMSLIGGGIVILVMVIITAVLAANVDKLNIGVSTSSLRAIITLVGLFVTLAAATMTYITAYVYRSSVLFITTEKVAEVSYKSLFNRTITQLGIGNVEDVSYAQTGILTRIFHYGTLTVETAGAEENSVFPFVPDPNGVSQMIIKAHEDYVEKFGN
jgi:hypothetical protein